MKWLHTGPSEWETFKGKLDNDFELIPDHRVYSNGPAMFWLKIRGREVPAGPFESSSAAKQAAKRKENSPCS